MAPPSELSNESALEKGVIRQRTSEGSTSVATLSKPPEPPRPEPPEGGRKAWLSLLGASLALFVSFGWVNCIALFQAEYETHQLRDYSQSEVSWITSMEFAFMLLFSPVAGRLFDNYGPRLPVAIGTFMHYYQFALSQSVCSGIGASFIFTPCMTAPMTFFRKKRALAGGLTIAGSSLGGVIFPLMVVRLIPRIGFPWTMRTCAFMILGLLVITNATISSNLEHSPRPFKISQYLRPLQEVNYLLIAISSFFLYWAMFVPFDYIVSAGIHYGMSTSMAFNLIPILNGTSFFGRTIPNMLADKFGGFNVMIIMMVYSMITVLAIWLPGRSSATSILFAALFGIGSGASIGLGPVLIMGISPMKEVGYRMGTIFAVAGIGALTSPPIGGAIVGATSGGDFDFACVFSGANYFVAVCLLVVLRVRLVGWEIMVKG
ncbi:major facilitator superfamily domain-containing protein [Aspergillus granulosus]|uniref:Major facilitator superfamily domain-containing protein n=1 Tax=Aspergillus granulosus TaxID=176169 RepID=A0ABR4H5K6_9EURO